MGNQQEMALFLMQSCARPSEHTFLAFSLGKLRLGEGDTSEQLPEKEITV